MANFDKSGMTQAGINLMGKAVGGATIQFTRLVLGDGTMTGEILDLQGVVSPKQNVDVTRIERNDNQCTVGGELLTSSVKQGFFWRECGLYAMDPDVGEILYNYAYSTKPDYIAASDSGMMEEILVSMVATVGSNTNVDVTIDDSMVLTTKKEFDPLKSKVDDAIYSVKDFGAVGDGQTDDTDAIKKAILSCNNLFFPDGEYLVDLENKIIITKTDMVIKFDKAAILKPLKHTNASNKNELPFLQLTNSENITIDGATIICDRDERTGSGSQFGITTQGSNKNITFKNITILNSACDGFYIYGGKNIVIDKCHVKNSSRCAIAVVSVDGLTIKNSILEETNGLNPQCGIDVEPFNAYDKIDKIKIINTQFLNNAKHDFILYPKHMYTENVSRTYNVLIQGCVFKNDTLNNGEAVWIEYISKLSKGTFIFKDNTIENKRLLYDLGTSCKYKVIIDSCDVINWNDGTNTNMYDKSCILVTAKTDKEIDPLGEIGGISISNVNFFTDNNSCDPIVIFDGRTTKLPIKKVFAKSNDNKNGTRCFAVNIDNNYDNEIFIDENDKKSVIRNETTQYSKISGVNKSLLDIIPYISRSREVILEITEGYTSPNGMVYYLTQGQDANGVWNAYLLSSYSWYKNKIEIIDGKPYLTGTSTVDGKITSIYTNNNNTKILENMAIAMQNANRGSTASRPESKI